MGRFFRGQMVARNSLLVTRVSHPRRAKHAPPPRPGSTHANFVCAGPGGGGHWCVSRCGRSSPPLEGWHDTGPRATRRVGGKCRGGKRVRNWILSLLSPRGLTTGPRSLKSRATRGQIYNDHIFYIPRILNLNLLTQINLYTWILGSSPRMTRKRMSQDGNTYSPKMTKRNGQDSTP